MIINEPGKKYEYEGKEYVISEVIVGRFGVYNGLFGNILEIHDGEDKETENNAPDVYCCFKQPVLPDDIEKLESLASRLYQQEKKLEDISLDIVIMSPEMIEPSVKWKF